MPQLSSIIYTDEQAFEALKRLYGGQPSKSFLITAQNQAERQNRNRFERRRQRIQSLEKNTQQVNPQVNPWSDDLELVKKNVSDYISNNKDSKDSFTVDQITKYIDSLASWKEETITYLRDKDQKKDGRSESKIRKISRLCVELNIELPSDVSDMIGGNRSVHILTDQSIEPMNIIRKTLAGFISESNRDQPLSFDPQRHIVQRSFDQTSQLGELEDKFIKKIHADRYGHFFALRINKIIKIKDLFRPQSDLMKYLKIVFKHLKKSIFDKSYDLSDEQFSLKFCDENLLNWQLITVQRPKGQTIDTDSLPNYYRRAVRKLADMADNNKRKLQEKMIKEDPDFKKRFLDINHIQGLKKELRKVYSKQTQRKRLLKLKDEKRLNLLNLVFKLRHQGLKTVVPNTCINEADRQERRKKITQTLRFSLLHLCQKEFPLTPRQLKQLKKLAEHDADYLIFSQLMSLRKK